MTMENIEKWLPVVGWEGLYEVSDQGRVRSLDRITYGRNGSTRVARGRILTPATGSTGYLTVSLSNRSHHKMRMVHILVAEAFIGARPAGHYCCHGDGVKLNNNLVNLRWDTPSGNMQDAVRHGTHFSTFRGRTHCIHGHEFTPENVMLRPGGRRCRACHRRSTREGERRRRAAAKIRTE